jgi:hypothetical protein
MKDADIAQLYHEDLMYDLWLSEMETKIEALEFNILQQGSVLDCDDLLNSKSE